MENSSTNFSPEMLAKINEVLKFAIENEYSDFYRKKYGNRINLPINSLEEFRKIPILTKEEILSTPIEDRIFIPIEQVASYSFSSGTTNHPTPTLIPRQRYDYTPSPNDMYSPETFKEYGVTKVMALLQPTAGPFRRMFAYPSTPTMFLPGDVHNLKVMAKIINQLRINGIMATPTILNLLIEELLSNKFDFSTIKWISIGSEFCSTLQFEYFKKIFPNAFFHIRYGNSEIGGGSRHFRCQNLTKNEGPGIFHIDKQVELIEIVDEEGNLTPFKEVGEMIHTDLKKKPFPLIRYKLNDAGSLNRKLCPCGNDIFFSIEGRMGFDALKTHGAIIYSELVAKAISKITDVAEPRFQLHIKEKSINGKPYPQLELRLKLKKEFENSRKDEILLQIIKEKISNSLQLSGKMTLSDFISKNIFLPLEITFVDTWPLGAKSKNIISHIK